MLTCLDLFSGIGGFSLGLERVGGFRTVAFCEIEPFCRAVLAKHWPLVPCHDDVRLIGGAQYRGQVDVVTGGVPCQPASVAGKRKGSSDERWLWPHFLSLVRSVQPVWVLAENPLGIVSLKPHGLAWIVCELHAAGYETQCLVIGADDVGAPHRRKRVWIVGHSSSAARERDARGFPEAQAGECGSREQDGDLPERSESASAAMGNSDIGGRGLEVAGREAQGRVIAGRTSEGVANSAIGGQRADGSASGDAGHTDVCRENLADSEQHGCRTRRRVEGDEEGAGRWRGESARGLQQWPSRPGEPQHEWEAPRLVEFALGGAIDGLPVRLARFANKQGLRACGNAIVPQVAEVIGRAILAGHSTTTIRSDA